MSTDNAVPNFENETLQMRIQNLLKNKDLIQEASSQMQMRFHFAGAQITELAHNFGLSAELMSDGARNKQVLSLIGCMEPEQLMYVFGVWNERDFLTYQNIKKQFVSDKTRESKTNIVQHIKEQVREQMNAQGAFSSPSPKTFKFMLQIDVINTDFHTILRYAADKGYTFSHNEMVLEGIEQLQDDLKLYALSGENPQQKGFSFDDGAPFEGEWSRNKPIRESEKILLHNSLMAVGHKMLAREMPMYSIADTLIENRIQESLIKVSESVMPYVYDDPQGFLQVQMSCNLIKEKLSPHGRLSIVERCSAIYQFIQKTRETLSAVYNQEEENTIVLNWYDKGTKGIIEELPKEITESKVSFIQAHESEKNKKQQGYKSQGRDRDE